MKRYEYLLAWFDGDEEEWKIKEGEDDSRSVTFDELGAEGWKLVAVEPETANYHPQAYFRRKVKNRSEDFGLPGDYTKVPEVFYK